MTSKSRTSLGFNIESDAPAPGDVLKSFDAKAYMAPKPRPSNDRPDREAVRKAGAEAGFVSREGEKPAQAVAPESVVPVRRPRQVTGRSAQVNVRATAEFKARFQALAAKNSWTDAVTFEKAIELLEEKYK